MSIVTGCQRWHVIIYAPGDTQTIMWKKTFTNLRQTTTVYGTTPLPSERTHIDVHPMLIWCLQRWPKIVSRACKDTNTSCLYTIINMWCIHIFISEYFIWAQLYSIAVVFECIRLIWVLVGLSTAPWPQVHYFIGNKLNKKIIFTILYLRKQK